MAVKAVRQWQRKSAISIGNGHQRNNQWHQPGEKSGIIMA